MRGGSRRSHAVVGDSLNGLTDALRRQGKIESGTRRSRRCRGEPDGWVRCLRRQLRAPQLHLINGPPRYDEHSCGYAEVRRSSTIRIRT